MLPIHRSVSVSWSPEAAFHRFTAEMGTWWPSRTHSVGEKRVQRIVFETREGGDIYEEHVDGRRFAWGRVTLWEPPQRVRFTWHPSRDPSTAQDVEVLFRPEGTGTRLELTAAGWERWGKGAARARRGYDVGWGYILNVWAQRRTGRMAMMDGLAGLLRAIQWLRGGLDAAISRAGGAMPPSPQVRS
jgi:hypothetical protein